MHACVKVNYNRKMNHFCVCKVVNTENLLVLKSNNFLFSV